MAHLDDACAGVSGPGENPGTWETPAVSLPVKKDPTTGKMLPVIGGLNKPAAREPDL